MKTIFKYAYVTLFAVLALASCTDEFDYTPANPNQLGGNATIEAAKSSYTFLPGQDQAVSFVVNRVDTTQAGTVNLVCDNEYFSVQPVSFAAGEASKTVTIHGNVPVGKTAKVAVSVADEDAFLYGVKVISFTVSVYKSIEGVLTSGFFQNPKAAVIYDLTNGDFMAPGLYQGGFDFKFHINFETNEVTAKPQYLFVYDEEHGRVAMMGQGEDQIVHGTYDPETLTASFEDTKMALPDAGLAFKGAFTEYITFNEDPNAQ